MIHRLIQSVICQLFMNLLCHRPAGYQLFQFAFRQSIIHLFNKMLYDIVAACIRPVILRLDVRIIRQLITVADDIPRTIDVHTAKTITVIPVPNCVIFIFQSIILQHFLYFLVQETKIFIKAHRRNGQDLKIIQSGKNTFLCHTQTACQHSEKQAVVCFQHLLKHIPDQQCHFLIISLLVRFRQGHIIFVNQNDYLLTKMLFQQSRQRLQAFHQNGV